MSLEKVRDEIDKSIDYVRSEEFQSSFINVELLKIEQLIRKHRLSLRKGKAYDISPNTSADVMVEFLEGLKGRLKE